MRRTAVVAAFLCLLAAVVMGEHIVTADVEGDAPNYGFEVLSSIDHQGAWGIWLHKNHLYVGNFDSECPGSGFGIDTYDVSDPANPVRVSHLPSPSDVAWTRHVRVGTLASEHFRGEVAVVPVECDRGGNLYPGTGRALMVWDVTDPADPRLLSTWGDPDFALGWHGAHTIEFHPPYVYLSMWSDGLAIIDISDPRNPEELQRMNFGGFVHFSYASDDGTRLYVSDAGAGLVILDVTEPGNATVIGWHLQTFPGSAFSASGEDGTWVVSTSHGECPSRPALILDTADETDPKLAASIRIEAMDRPCPNPSGATPLEIQIRGNLVFITWTGAGLQVFNVSNPYAPTEFSKWSPPTGELSGINPGPKGLFVEGDLIFVSSAMKRVHILRFDTMDVAFDVETSTPGSLTARIVLTYTSDGSPVRGASVTIGDSDAVEEDPGFYKVVLGTLSPLFDLQLEVSVTGFPEASMSSGGLHLGNAILIAVLLTVGIVTAVFFAKRRRS
ncbi:MAG: LVIVD repeat-containing protein [Thermoplasmata archaeon]